MDSETPRAEVAANQAELRGVQTSERERNFHQIFVPLPLICGLNNCLVSPNNLPERNYAGAAFNVRWTDVRGRTLEPVPRFRQWHSTLVPMDISHDAFESPEDETCSSADLWSPR